MIVPSSLLTVTLSASSFAFRCNLGNLASRALTMVARYCEGKVPPRPTLPPEDAEGFEALLQRDLEQDPPETDFLCDVFARYERLDFAGARSATKNRMSSAREWMLSLR